MLRGAKQLVAGLVGITGIAIFICGAYPGPLPFLASGSETPKVAMSSIRAIFVTTPTLEVAKKIAHGLVSNKLVACVNIIPQVTSVYEWEGKINEDSELLLMIKTDQSKFAEVEKFVKANHPYDVPEVIAVPVEQGSEKYLQWVKDTVAGKS